MKSVTHTHPTLASVLLSLYQELYDIEDRGHVLEPSALLSLRQSEATGVWQRLRDVLDGEQFVRLLPKEPLNQAVGYLNNHRQRCNCTCPMPASRSTTMTPSNC